MADDHKGVIDILDELKEAASDASEVSVGDMHDCIGERSYGPFLLVPALLEISPIGGIPGVPTAIATVIVMLAVQMLVGREQFWLPGFIENRTVSSDRLLKAVDKMRPVGRWLDRWFHGRLRPLTRGVWIKVAALLCIGLACTVPPLELLPFASTVPMAAIAMFGLAVLVSDGLLMLVAMILSLIAFWVGLSALLG